jgi:hypothetical protein
MPKSVIQVKVGEEVLVSTEFMGRLRVLVLRLVDDVNKAASEYDPNDPDFVGPGFEASICDGQNESGELVFALAQVVSRKAEYCDPTDFGGVYGR